MVDSFEPGHTFGHVTLLRKDIYIVKKGLEKLQQRLQRRIKEL